MTDNLPVITTLTGIPITEIQPRLNAHLPAEAYKEIPNGRMSGKTDLDLEHVARRFSEVFGPNGLGWAIEPIPETGNIVVTPEVRKSRKGDDQQWYVVDVINYHLRYTLVMPDGSYRDCYGSALSDSLDMEGDRGYAIEGAMSTLIKQAFRRMGGMDDIYFQKYGHRQSAANNQPAKPQSQPPAKPATSQPEQSISLDDKPSGHSDPNVKLSTSKARTAFMLECQAKGKNAGDVMKKMNEAGHHSMESLTHGEALAIVFGKSKDGFPD